MIGLINYGTGNLNALINQLNYLKEKYLVIDHWKDFEKVDHLILPGIGSFDYCKSKLVNSNLIEGLNEKVHVKKTPILGICVGMQLMSNTSEEGENPGLGWIDGKVKKFDSVESEQKLLIPHMGWNSINITNNDDYQLFQGVDCNIGFYFVHSFYFDCENPKNILTQTEYSINFHSGIINNHIIGVQFHPEKSHSNGTTLIQNFIRI